MFFIHGETNGRPWIEAEGRHFDASDGESTKDHAERVRAALQIDQRRAAVVDIDELDLKI